LIPDLQKSPFSTFFVKKITYITQTARESKPLARIVSPEHGYVSQTPIEVLHLLKDNVAAVTYFSQQRHLWFSTFVIIGIMRKTFS